MIQDLLRLERNTFYTSIHILIQIFIFFRLNDTCIVVQTHTVVTSEDVHDNSVCTIGTMREQSDQG